MLIIQCLITFLYLFPHWSQMDSLDLFTVSDISFWFFHGESDSLPTFVFLLFCFNGNRSSTRRFKSWLTIGFVATVAAASLATTDSAGVSFLFPSLVFVDSASLTVSINLRNRHFYKLNHCFLTAIHTINNYWRKCQKNMAAYCIKYILCIRFWHQMPFFFLPEILENDFASAMFSFHCFFVFVI
jgi:hypothetical protein